MSSKSEFYTALDHLKQAAKDAFKAMPDSFGSRERNIWTALLTRLPEQIDGIRDNMDDPHTPTYEGQMRRRGGLIIPD